MPWGGSQVIETRRPAGALDCTGLMDQVSSFTSLLRCRHLNHVEVGRTMIAAPWYLFAVGVVLVLVGVISGSLFGSGRASRRPGR